ncbi:glycosyl hydrolase [Prolixibacteraceae bacterium Z1-6]|uniref:Glycosyl hydrolase n=1 Tax=Draconibacterium aestuarii TaxID=2998507 RepID=A0A9X3J9E0_9BACT|nr:glycosyl hydrolase [Prolixibacteraceae bacterium Z1-6]
MNCKNLLLLALIILVASCTKENVSYNALRSAFQNPPNSAKPGVYWYFMDGNQDKGEMTADLESMKEVGIEHVLFLEVNVGIPLGPVKFLSEEWQENFVHAVKECERLGIVLTLGSGPGWTGSGGPWVKMEESMQHLVASKVEVSGPAKVSKVLEVPAGRNPFFGLGGFTPELRERWNEYYQDVAVLAFPASENVSTLSNSDEKALYYRPPYSSREGVIQYFPEPALQAENFEGNGTGIPTKEIIDITQFMAEDGTLKWEAPEGKWTIMRFGRRNNGAITRPAPMPGLGFECDKMSAEAMKHHLEHFMIPLIEKVQPDSTKQGGWKMIHMDSWEMGAQNWTDDFMQKFKALKGYDPLPYLPVFTGMIVGDVEKSERFLWDLRMVSQELILESHVQYFKDFGRKYGMGLSIEPYDMNPNTDLDLGSYADVPMCEFWNKGFGFNTGFSTFEGTSIANLYGRSVVAAEAFTSHLVAWKSYPGSIKNQNDWAFCSGINRLVYHTFAHKAIGEQYRPGMTMGPYGVHWDRGQTWWDMSGAYHEYVARSQALLQQGKGVADVLYLIGEGAPHVFLPPASAVEGNQYLEGYKSFDFDAETDQIIASNSTSIKEFMPDRKGYNFDGCSPRILIDRASVKNGKVGFEGGASYEILVLPQISSMTPELLKKIESLVQQGATVIGHPALQSPSLNNYPNCDDEVKSLSEKMWGSFNIPEKETEISYGKGKILWGGNYSNPDGDELYPNYTTTANYLNSIGVQPDFTADGTVRYIHKKMPETDLYFVSNRTKAQTKVICEFRVDDASPELWNPMTGEIRALPEFTVNEGTISVPLQFEAYEAYAIVFSNVAQNKVIKGDKNFYPKKKVQTVDGSWEVTFDSNWGGPEKVTFDQLEDWIERPEEGIKHYSGKAIYAKTFDCEQTGKSEKLFLNLGKVNNMARVKLNGKDLGIIWTTPLEVEITDAVQEKNNHLEIEVVNLWGNRLIGDEAYEDDGIVNGQWPEWVLNDKPRSSKRYTFTTWKHYTKDSALQSSGLLGPVTILARNKKKED